MTNILTQEHCIAYRILTFVDKPDQTLNVFIGKPFLVNDDEWHCPYRIVGLDLDFSSSVIGIDSIQALQLVFNIIDSVIESNDLELLWLDETFKGFCGH